MAYLVPAEFVTKMVDAGESKIFMSTRDTLIRSYMAGAILALAAVFARVFMAGVVVDGVGAGVGALRRFFRIVIGIGGRLTGHAAVDICFVSASMMRWFSAAVGVACVMLSTLGSGCCCCFLLCCTSLCSCAGCSMASCRTVCNCCMSWLELNAGRPQRVSMHAEIAFMILSSGLTAGFVMRLCWNSTVSLNRSLLVALM